MKNELNNEIKTRLEAIDVIKSRMRKLSKARQLIVETEAQIPMDEVDSVLVQYQAEIEHQKKLIAKAKKKVHYLELVEALDEEENDPQMHMDEVPAEAYDPALH